MKSGAPGAALPSRRKKTQQPESCCGRFPHTKTACLRYRQEADQTQHSSRSPDLRILNPARLLGTDPNGRLSSCAESPRLQWRYRSGFAPDSLFFAAPRMGWATLKWSSLFLLRIASGACFVNLILRTSSESLENRGIRLTLLQKYLAIPLKQCYNLRVS